MNSELDQGQAAPAAGGAPSRVRGAKIPPAVDGLDQLGRSMPHPVGLVEELLGKGIGFRSLSDGAIGTTTSRVWHSSSVGSARSAPCQA